MGGFFLKPKLNKTFPFFRFDIYFKSNLVLTLRFKVINVKKLHLNNLKRKFTYRVVNIFRLINSCNWKPYLYNIFAMKDLTTCLCSFNPLVYLARFSICMQKFQLEKKVCTHHWNLMNEQHLPLKKVFCKNKYSDCYILIDT